VVGAGAGVAAGAGAGGRRIRGGRRRGVAAGTGVVTGGGAGSSGSARVLSPTSPLATVQVLLVYENRSHVIAIDSECRTLKTALTCSRTTAC